MLLFVLMLYILAMQLNVKNVSLAQFKAIFSSLNSMNLMYGLLAFLLMPVNWFLESFKWKKLVQVVQQPFILLDAVRAVLIGVFFGFITPNRVGEFGGRLFKIAKGNKVNALNLSLVGGFAQFVITFLVGITCSFWLLLAYFDLNILFGNLLLLFIYLSTFIIYFNFKGIIKRLLSFKKFQKFSDQYVFNFNLSQVFLLEILLLTFVRYAVYVFQYVLILYCLGAELNFLFLFKTISIMLLIQTIIPSFALIDIGIRGNVLLFLLSDYIDNQLIIVVSVLLVWILNLVLPAIIGYLNFINLKLEVKNEKSNNHINTTIRK